MATDPTDATNVTFLVTSMADPDVRVVMQGSTPCVALPDGIDRRTPCAGDDGQAEPWSEASDGPSVSRETIRLTWRSSDGRVWQSRSEVFTLSDCHRMGLREAMVLSSRTDDELGKCWRGVTLPKTRRRLLKNSCCASDGDRTYSGHVERDDADGRTMRP
jgi:hypothetical protein